MIYLNLKKSKSAVSLNRRTKRFTMNALEKLRCNRLLKQLEKLDHVNRLCYSKSLLKHKIKNMIKMIEIKNIIRDQYCCPAEDYLSPLPKLKSKNRTIDSFLDHEIPQYFRFETKDQLRELLIGLQIPNKIKLKCRNTFRGEELLLVSLYRLHRPSTLNDGSFREIFGFEYHKVSKCFNAFVNFMVIHWGYILLDNTAYWKDHLPEFSEKIRLKCASYGCDFLENQFSIFGFIDNTMNSTCRPGGGPARDGTNAPRNDPNIQRAWYYNNYFNINTNHILVFNFNFNLMLIIFKGIMGGKKLMV